jgi:hypothetical protein
MDLDKLKNNLPDLHSADTEEKELFEKNSLPKKTTPHIYHSNVDVNRPNYDNYMFRCHALGKLIGGIPKPISQAQQETYKAYKERFETYGALLPGEKGTRGKELSQKQLNDFHSIGAKMSAKIELSAAAKAYCEELVNQDAMGYSASIKSQQIWKGIVREEDSIKLYSEFLGIELKKNTERKNNRFWSGEWDLEELIRIITDIKTSWTRETFAKTAVDNRSSAYDWQGQGYLDLTGRDIFKLAYCLVDSLPHQVNNIVNRMLFNHDYGTVSGEVEESAIPVIVEEVTNHFVTRKALKEFCDMSGVVHYEWFTDFYEPPIEKRIKVFEFQRDEKMISNLKELVMLAREYMNNLIK